MQVKGISVVPVMDSDGFAVLAARFRPSRLTAAGVCMQCGTRWCRSAACVRRHEASLWAVCPTCDGFAVSGCEGHCASGVVEVNRAGLIALADRVLPRYEDDLSYEVAGTAGVAVPA